MVRKTFLIEKGFQKRVLRSSIFSHFGILLIFAFLNPGILTLWFVIDFCAIRNTMFLCFQKLFFLRKKPTVIAYVIIDKDQKRQNTGDLETQKLAVFQNAKIHDL